MSPNSSRTRGTGRARSLTARQESTARCTCLSLSSSTPRGLPCGTCPTTAAVRQTVEDPEFRAAMAKVETPISYLDAPEFQKFWDADAAKLAEAVKRTGLVEQRK